MIQAGARLDRLPISRFHRRLLLLIGLGGLFDSFDLYLGGSVLAALVQEGWSTVSLNAIFISSTFVGMTLGAWLAGVLGDRHGRRFTYQANLLIFGLASLAAAFAPSMNWLIAFRLIMGIGLGAELVAATGMLAEYVPPHHRGRWYALLSCLVNCGMFLQTVLGLYLIPAFSWRSMFIVAAVGALVLWYLRKSMPESPRWLEQQGRLEEAEQVLRSIEQEVERQTGAPLPPVPTAPATLAGQAPLSRLFGPDVWRRTLVATVICLVVNTTAFSFVTWLPTFFVKQGFSIASSLGFVTFMSLGGPVGALIGYLLADRLGRRKGILCAIPPAIVFAMIYPFVRDPVLTPLVGFLFLSSLYAFFAFGYYGYMGELFPTAFRLRGIGFAHTVGRFATMFTPFLVASLYSGYAIGGVVALVVGSLVAAFAAVLAWGIETRDRTLEQIERDSGAAPAGVRAAASRHSQV